MGVIIHVSNDITHYASVNTNSLSVEKIIIDPSIGNGLVASEDDPRGDMEISNVIVTNYVTHTILNVWDDETNYRDRMRDMSIQDITVNSTSNTLPDNLYTEVYTKFKSGLASFTDDI
tara:strand:+ start:310 stop:663 length:354 start_codon:yes stop_codon:yes gene_type:complete